MKIILKHLELCNFGMFRSYELDFAGDVTSVYGRNGSGKSTIANAVQWLFTGKSTDGRSQFAIKTHDSMGNEIPKVDHYVRAVCLINDEETELKKGISEKWTKVKGEDRETMSNQTYYFINGTPLSQKEWNDKMNSFVSGDVFKAVTNPNYFLSLDWKTQRDFLYRISGGVTKEEIIGSDTKFDPLLKSLEHQSIEEVLKHVGYQIKELQKKLDLIPVRLQEQDKALPEKLDWPALKVQLEEKNATLKSLQTRLSDMRRNPSGALHVELESKLNDVGQQIFRMKNKKQEIYDSNRKTFTTEIRTLTTEISQTEGTVADLNAKIDGLDKLVKRAEQAKGAAVIEKQKIETEFETLRNTHLHINPNAEYCPTCGQLLPREQFLEKREQLQEAFNKDKVEKSNSLKARYQDAKKDIAEAEDTANHYNGEIAKVKVKVLSLQSELDTSKQKLAGWQQKLESLLTPEQELSFSPEYVELEREHARLVAQIENSGESDTGEQEKSLLSQIEAVSSEISSLQQSLASEAQYNRVMENKAGIENERVGLANRITELESQQDLATEYSNRQGNILEEKVNSKFSLCYFKMFRDYLNGSREDWCECYDRQTGTAYHDGMNSSMRLNVGLDIVNTLCEVYRAWCPILCDNAESSLSIVPTKSQQIRFYVSDTNLTAK